MKVTQRSMMSFGKSVESLSQSLQQYHADRRHGEVCFMAIAISVRDLKAEVSKRCQPETPIPSESLIRLNFEPRNLVPKSLNTTSTGILLRQP